MNVGQLLGRVPSERGMIVSEDQTFVGEFERGVWTLSETSYEVVDGCSEVSSESERLS